jgi:hypothetical protein
MAVWWCLVTLLLLSYQARTAVTQHERDGPFVRRSSRSMATRWARRRAHGAWPTCAPTWPTRPAPPPPSTGSGPRCSARWVSAARGLPRAWCADVTRIARCGWPWCGSAWCAPGLAATAAHEQPPLHLPDRELNLTRAVARPWRAMAPAGSLPLSVSLWSSARAERPTQLAQPAHARGLSRTAARRQLARGALSAVRAT